MISNKFKLASEPKVKISKSKGPFKGSPWLEFTEADIICLARFCINHKNKHPVLIIECGRGEDKGSHFFEGYEIDSLSITSENISINGSIDGLPIQLQLYSDKEHNKIGTAIQRIQTLPEHFPMDEYLAFRNKQITYQTRNKSKKINLTL